MAVGKYVTFKGMIRKGEMMRARKKTSPNRDLSLRDLSIATLAFSESVGMTLVGTLRP